MRLLRSFRPDYTSASLDELAGGIRASDPRALDAVFVRLGAPLHGYLRSLVGDEAGDVLQDVFLALWESRRSIDIRVGLRPYLYRAARNRALNHRRKMRRIDLPGDLPERRADLPPDPELAQRLESAIDTLPPRRAEAFRLSRQHDLTHEQIARIMDLSPRTVQTHIVHALRDLRAALHEPHAATGVPS